MFYFFYLLVVIYLKSWNVWFLFSDFYHLFCWIHPKLNVPSVNASVRGVRRSEQDVMRGEKVQTWRTESRRYYGGHQVTRCERLPERSPCWSPRVLLHLQRGVEFNLIYQNMMICVHKYVLQNLKRHEVEMRTGRASRRSCERPAHERTRVSPCIIKHALNTCYRVASHLLTDGAEDGDAVHLCWCPRGTWRWRLPSDVKRKDKMFLKGSVVLFRSLKPWSWTST